jgi:hypothetical protein
MVGDKVFIKRKERNTPELEDVMVVTCGAT